MSNWNKGIAKITLPTPFAVGDVHAYLVKGDRLTLVDAGVKTETAWLSFQHQLKQLKLKLSDIEQVIITHHHPDHIGLLHFLPPDIEVYGHPTNERWLNITQQFLKRYDNFFKLIHHKCGIPEQLTESAHELKKSLRFFSERSLTSGLSDGETPQGMHGWQVIETLGHAQTHIVLHNEKTELLLGGDHLLAHISSNPLLEPPLIEGGERPQPQLQYNESLRKLLNYPIEQVLPGHGPNVTNVYSLINERLSRQHERALKVREIINNKRLTIFEICQRLFPKAHKRELGLTISETVAQLDYLQSFDTVKTLTRDDGILLFTAN